MLKKDQYFQTCISILLTADQLGIAWLEAVGLGKSKQGGKKDRQREGGQSVYTFMFAICLISNLFGKEVHGEGWREYL